MGTDLEIYVHPERISSQLICPICTQVLKNPVQTSTDHLFCEDELLEWLTRSNLCPVTKAVLEPEKIKKPRIILNMLAELEVFCENKCEGCVWTGPHDQLIAHVKGCSFQPRERLLTKISDLKATVVTQQAHIFHLEERNEALIDENIKLQQLADDYRKRLRVFHALLPSENRPANAIDGDDYTEESTETFRGNSSTTVDHHNVSVAERLQKLRALKTLPNDADSRREDKPFQHKCKLACFSLK